MLDEEYWAAVRSMRLQVADFLDLLNPAEWDTPSLCAGWRVRDVAGHLSLVPTVTTLEMLAVAPRALGNPNRINTVLARRYGSHEPEWITARIREHAASRHSAKALDARNVLFDLIVHGQDMARPLQRELAIPVAYSRAGLERVWSMGWPFHARRRLAGLRLTAEDADWSVGDGPEITGPALELLLLLTGREQAALPALSGAGLEAMSG